MLLSLRKNGLTSLFKEVRVFKRENPVPPKVPLAKIPLAQPIIKLGACPVHTNLFLLLKASLGLHAFGSCRGSRFFGLTGRGAESIRVIGPEKSSEIRPLLTFSSLLSSLEGLTCKPQHTGVSRTHSERQATSRIHCIRMFKRVFFHTRVLKTHRHSIYQCLKPKNARVFKRALQHAHVRF